MKKMVIGFVACFAAFSVFAQEEADVAVESSPVEAQVADNADSQESSVEVDVDAETSL